MPKIDPNRMFVPRDDVNQAIDLVTAKLEKEIAAHAVTKEALELSVTARAATQGELDNLKGQLERFTQTQAASHLPS